MIVGELPSDSAYPSTDHSNFLLSLRSGAPVSVYPPPSVGSYSMARDASFILSPSYSCDVRVFPRIYMHALMNKNEISRTTII